MSGTMEDEKKMSKDLTAGDGGHDAGAGVALVVSHNGMKLHPQPTTDPLDPLNWTFVRKHSILAIVMAL